MIRKDKVETEYLPELPLMLSIGVIRALVVFPQSHHYPPQRGGTLVTAGRRPADSALLPTVSVPGGVALQESLKLCYTLCFAVFRYRIFDFRDSISKFCNFSAKVQN